MNPNRVVSRDEWLTARKAFLAKEKELTHARDRLSRERRELPWVRVDKEYVFDGPAGKETLSDLFAGTEPAARLPLHVRPGVGGGLPELLVLGRQLQRHRRAPGAPRRDAGRGLAGAAREARGLQAAHGLELQVGVVARQRLQPRLSRLLHARGAEGGATTTTRSRRSGSARLRASACSPRTMPAPSITPTPAIRAASTRSTAPTSSSTSFPRAATRRACRIRWRGCAATTDTRTDRRSDLFAGRSFDVRVRGPYSARPHPHQSLPRP